MLHAAQEFLHRSPGSTRRLLKTAAVGASHSNAPRDWRSAVHLCTLALAFASVATAAYSATPIEARIAHIAYTAGQIDANGDFIAHTATARNKDRDVPIGPKMVARVMLQHQATWIISAASIRT